MNDMIVKGLAFEGRGLTAVTMAGRPMVMALEFGAVLQYSDGGRGLVSRIGGEWSAEFKADVHYVKVEGQPLADLKELITSGVISGISLGTRARSLILLTEAGVNLVLLKTEKPEGIRLRAYLAETIMPALARGEGIPARGEAEPPKYRNPENVRALREQRLLSQMQVKVIENEAARALARGLAPAVVDAWRTTQLEKATGIPMHRLLPVEVERWYSLGEVAAALGLPHATAGHVVSRVPGFEPRRNIDGMMRGIMNHAPGQERSVTTYEYTAAAIEKIRPFAAAYLQERATIAEQKAARQRMREARAEQVAQKERERAEKRARKAAKPTAPEQPGLGLVDGRAAG